MLKSCLAQVEKLITIWKLMKLSKVKKYIYIGIS